MVVMNKKVEKIVARSEWPKSDGKVSDMPAMNT
jgi:hypothetical protein